MQYREFGKRLNWQVSALGFGAMRLPILENDTARIDEPQAIQMIRNGIDHGINYVDTAYGYHTGKSEVVVGKALKQGYREKVKLATKLPCWLINSREDMDTKLQEQLIRLDMPYIDFYLLHALSKDSWSKMQGLGVLEWAEKKIAEGVIGKLGFSFHDDYPAFKKIIDDYDSWTFCQIYINYLDQDKQATLEGMRYATEKGIAVVIMEPLRGGKLAQPTQHIQEIWDTSKIKRPPVQWALDWLWTQPEISLVLSGMSTLQQVEENLVYADESRIGKLSPTELDMIENVRQEYLSLIRVNCTACRYCMPCPNNVNIPELFGIYNEAAMFETWEPMKKRYQDIQGKKASVDYCLECGVCEEACPQFILIPERLLEVQKALGKPS